MIDLMALKANDCKYNQIECNLFHNLPKNTNKSEPKMSVTFVESIVGGYSLRYRLVLQPIYCYLSLF